MSLRAKALLVLLSLSAPLVAVAGTYAQSDSPEGFASMSARDKTGLGRAGGNGCHRLKQAEFLDYISRTDPNVIHLDGTITMSGMVKVQSHKSIIGVGANGVITGGGLNLDEVSNIIIRNFLFEDSVR